MLVSEGRPACGASHKDAAVVPMPVWLFGLQLEERVRGQAHRLFTFISDASSALATRTARITLEAQLNVAQYKSAYHPRSSSAG